MFPSEFNIKAEVKLDYDDNQAQLTKAEDGPADYEN